MFCYAHRNKHPIRRTDYSAEILSHDGSTCTWPVSFKSMNWPYILASNLGRMQERQERRERLRKKKSA